MSTCLNSAPHARSAATACAEKPHCGKSGDPFMKSTTGLDEICVLMRSITSIFTLQKASWGRAYSAMPPRTLNYGARHPNLQGCARGRDSRLALDSSEHLRGPVNAARRIATSSLDIPPDLPRQVAAALQEDVGTGDATARLVPESQLVRGEVVSREAAVICGAPWVEETFRQLDERVSLEWLIPEGGQVEPEQIVFRIAGPARAVLTGERTALNFLQLLSGTATAARRFVDAVAGTHCTVLDTRKTMPGLRTA